MKPSIYSYTLALGLLLLILLQASPVSTQPKTNLMSTLAEATVTNSALSQVVKNAGLMPLLSNKGPYTFFAPSDEALAKMSQLTPDQARDVLMAHLVEGRYTTTDLHDGAVLTSMGRQTMKVCRKKGKLMLNGIVITTPDQAAANGIMHTVNGLFLRPGQQASTL